ncbi:MAG: hypothetical protein AMXMBFR77_26640 [Phycisphaerales bacterium]
MVEDHSEREREIVAELLGGPGIVAYVRVTGERRIRVRLMGEVLGEPSSVIGAMMGVLLSEIIQEIKDCERCEPGFAEAAHRALMLARRRSVPGSRRSRTAVRRVPPDDAGKGGAGG